MVWAVHRPKQISVPGPIQLLLDPAEAIVLATTAPLPTVILAALVLVASGTTTLEVAFHQRPMIVMYQASRAFYQLIGRWLLHTPYYALPNILAGREIVPEFMPYYTSTAPIAEKAIALLQSPDARAAMAQDLADTVAPLRSGSASHRTAEMLLEMVDRSHH